LAIQQLKWHYGNHDSESPTKHIFDNMLAMLTTKKQAHLAFVVGVCVILLGSYMNVRGPSDVSVAISGETEAKLLDMLQVFEEVIKFATPSHHQNINVLYSHGVTASTSLIGSFEESVRRQLDFNVSFYYQPHDNHEKYLNVLEFHCNQEDLQAENIMNRNGFELQVEDYSTVKVYVKCDDEKRIDLDKHQVVQLGRMYSSKFKVEISTDTAEMDFTASRPINNIHFEFVLEGRNSHSVDTTNQIKFKQFETDFINPVLRNISDLFSFQITSSVKRISTLSTTHKKVINSGDVDDENPKRNSRRHVTIENLMTAINHGTQLFLFYCVARVCSVLIVVCFFLVPLLFFYSFMLSTYGYIYMFALRFPVCCGDERWRRLFDYCGKVWQTQPSQQLSHLYHRDCKPKRAL
jgi:hypothetical protein